MELTRTECVSVGAAAVQEVVHLSKGRWFNELVGIEAFAIYVWVIIDMYCNALGLD